MSFQNPVFIPGPTNMPEPFIFPATGTGGWEAAITNTLSPGDKVLARATACSPSLDRHVPAPRPRRRGRRDPWGEGAPADRSRRS
jgi:alanine-glyoxylate transaminase/serine-glyoxylate transaminase/serine-pyruvate transaminase